MNGTTVCMSADVQIEEHGTEGGFCLYISAVLSRAKQSHNVDLAAAMVVLQVPSAKQDFTVFKSADGI